MSNIIKARELSQREHITLDQALELLKLQELQEIQHELHRLADDGGPSFEHDDEPTPVPGRAM